MDHQPQSFIVDVVQILCADLDLGAITRSRLDFDVCGHYSRPDVFELLIK